MIKEKVEILISNNMQVDEDGIELAQFSPSGTMSNNSGNDNSKPTSSFRYIFIYCNHREKKDRVVILG